LNLESKSAQKPLWRIGRQPDPWQPADWAYAREDGTFGNRFDDPQGLYRVLYTSSQRLGCYVETLARFRPDLSLLQELEDILGENDFYPSGTVPLEWLDERLIGSARVKGSFADIYASGWISELRHRLAAQTLALGFLDLDLAVLQNAQPRRLTQLASRVVFRKGLAGVYYGSRYGHDLENWAIFEPFEGLAPLSPEKPRQNDPDLIRACQILGITFA
jgi:hypothetical protein